MKATTRLLLWIDGATPLSNAQSGPPSSSLLSEYYGVHRLFGMLMPCVSTHVGICRPGMAGLRRLSNAAPELGKQPGSTGQHDNGPGLVCTTALEPACPLNRLCVAGPVDSCMPQGACLLHVGGVCPGSTVVHGLKRLSTGVM